MSILIQIIRLLKALINFKERKYKNYFDLYVGGTSSY